MPSCSLSLQVTLQAVETLLPEPAVALQPAGDRLQRYRVHLIQALAAQPRVDHEPGVAQNLQVLGDGRAAGPEISRESAGVRRPGPEAVQDGPARRVRDGAVDGVRGGSLAHYA